MKRISLVSFLLIFTISLISCAKEAGEGGNSTIYGKLTAYDYNAEFTSLKGIYPAADEDVYLIYGSDRSYSQRVRSNYNGIYEFKYMRPGDYKVYVYSKDSTLTLPSGIYAITADVKIDGNKQTVEVAELKIFR
jgi:hypothetical protein